MDILNPLDPDDDMPMDKVREVAGEKMVLCGGMDKHFYDWDRDTRYTSLQKIIRRGRKSAPHILMDSGGIPENVNRPTFDDFLAMSEELRSR